MLSQFVATLQKLEQLRGSLAVLFVSVFPYLQVNR